MHISLKYWTSLNVIIWFQSSELLARLAELPILIRIKIFEHIQMELLFAYDSEYVYIFLWITIPDAYVYKY